MDMTGRVLLLGENNPYGSDPEFALYCYPQGCAGFRLRRILGLPEDQYLSLHRKNLCDGDWSKAEARDRVWDLLSPEAPWNVIVLLGRKVAEVFEKAALEGVPIVAFSTRVCCPGKTLISLPHPSGRNVVWNQPWAPRRARAILGEVVPELPWGSADDSAAAMEASA